MPEFFLELFSEEIPARMQRDAAESLEAIGYTLSIDLGAPENAKIFYGPRRIAVAATVGDEKPGSFVEERGPRVSAPDAAISGFLRKHKAGREHLVAEGDYYILRRNLPPISALEYLNTNLAGLLSSNLRWPKSMRWGQSGDFAWVRPLRRIVCLLDGEVIQIKIGPVTAGNETEGHRVFGFGPFGVSSAGDWEQKLKAHYVIADQDKRKNNIVDGMKAKAKYLGLTVAKDDILLDEVTGLVEWPVALIGKIDEQFMDLPQEVRELSMKVNQKYFALRDADGKPAPYFAFVANLEAPYGGAAIIAGNERVLRARLSDARHFWDLDLKTPLDTLLPKLEKITFHAKIGTQLQRSERIAHLAKKIAKMLGANDATAEQAELAGRLCKADLVTGMVGEFPELQGIMGGYYAEKNPRDWDGKKVGAAIKTHYQPKGPSDLVPFSIDRISESVALADKLDTLVQFFRVKEKPTGSSDPYALRRAALGIIRIILDNDLTLPLKPLLDSSQDLFEFIMERFRVSLRNEGRRFDIVDAVLSAGRDDDLMRLRAKISVLTARLNTDDGINLLAGYRRAVNILRIEEEKDGPIKERPDISLFNETEENLHTSIFRLPAYTYLLSEDNKSLISFKDFEGAVAMLATLRAPVDAFFDKVTVNDPDPKLRRNRLALLAQLRDTMHQIADFSKIEG